MWILSDDRLPPPMESVLVNVEWDSEVFIGFIANDGQLRCDTSSWLEVVGDAYTVNVVTWAVDRSRPRFAWQPLPAIDKTFWEKARGHD